MTSYLPKAWCGRPDLVMVYLRSRRLAPGDRTNTRHRHLLYIPRTTANPRGRAALADGDLDLASPGAATRVFLFWRFTMTRRCAVREEPLIYNVEENRKRGSLYVGGNWIMFPRAFLFIMSRDEALLLAFLGDVENYAVKEGQTEDGWFYCTTSRIEKEMNMDRQVQVRNLERLRARGFVEVKQTGGPPARRHVRIHWTRIDDRYYESR